MWIMYPLSFIINLYFIPETTISCLTAFMIFSIHLVSAYLWVFTFHFLCISLEKQLCIHSFSFFPFFKKVLSLWIFSEDVWNWWAVISTLFPRLTSALESHSCHECVCWSWHYGSSWTQLSAVNTVINPNASSALCLSVDHLKYFLKYRQALLLFKHCRKSTIVIFGDADFCFLFSSVWRDPDFLLTQLLSGTELMVDIFVHALLVLILLF